MVLTRAQRAATGMPPPAPKSVPKATRRRVKSAVASMKKAVSKSKKTPYYAYINGHWRRAYLRAEKTRFFVIVNKKRVSVTEAKLMDKSAISEARRAAKNRRRRERRAAKRGSSYKRRGTYKKRKHKKRRSRKSKSKSK